MRSSKAVVNRIASVLGMLVALVFALIIALGLGVTAYALSSPEIMTQITRREARGAGAIPSAQFIFFSILAFFYLMWATLPLSVGTGRQFEPGRLLMYPISLRKLFALDFVSETVNLQSIFAIPAILALGIGAGLGKGTVAWALPVALLAAIFGLALAKWLSISVGSMMRRKRARAESLLALLGVIIGLGGAALAEIAPAFFKYAESFRGLRWTPPGAVAVALTVGLAKDGGADYFLALATLVGYSGLLIMASFWIAQRAALGKGGGRRDAKPKLKTASESYTGWELPGLSAELAAVVEKELRYVFRNAQARLMVLMPLILIVLRVVNTNRLSAEMSPEKGSFASEILTYAEGLIATGGVLYVFLILTGISCNLFAFEESGMRTLILSPVARAKILVGKNIAVTIMALIFSGALLLVNELIFGDLTFRGLIFAALSFIVFAGLMSIIGNALSVRFPKRMKFGKRMNVSGATGLLLIPIIILLALPPLAAAAAGFIAQSLLVEYATLALFAVLAVGAYLLLIGSQGEALQRREVEILEAIREPSDT
ncbi:MAG TPA: hypothetical protein VFH15_13640 [Pyrinomonadaceae bacterium]|nr:hypothetical protein [Pyrinomonadaceae bacterium]